MRDPAFLNNSIIQIINCLQCKIMKKNRCYDGFVPIVKQNLKRMKLTVLIFMLSVASSFANGLLSQDARFNLEYQNQKISSLISEIEETTEFRFFYNEEVNVNQLTTIAVTDGTLEETLDEIFEGQGISYEIVGKQIILKPGDIASMQQSLTIKGVVKDSSGELVPGVTVVVKGTSNGTITGINGDYVLQNVPEDGVLIYSFIGFKTKEISVGGKMVIDVVMEEETIGLQEVVAIGYGEMKKSDLTGSVSSVSSDNFNKGTQMPAQQLVQGKISGVNVSLNSGKPGGSTTVRVRGGTSISASNDPLYVIDGVPISSNSSASSANISGNGTDFFDQEPINPLMTLNPNDIESINVLKDASATAIYGSRGANGVIMITTKKGKAGKAQVSYDVSTSIANVANTLDVLSADEYVNTLDEINSSLDIDDQIEYTNMGGNTDWQDKIYRTAVSQDHYLSLSGGQENTNYRISLGYGDQQGVMLASKLEKLNARVNINHNALDGKLKFDFRMNYGENKSNQAPVSNTVGSEAGSSMNYEAYVFNPTYPVKDENGDYYHVLPYRINPVSFSTDVIDKRTTRRFLGNLSTSYQIADPLSIRVNLGYTHQGIDRNSYISKENPLGEGFGGYVSVQKLQDYSKLMETFMTYKEDFGDLSVNAVAGYSYQYFFNEGIRNVGSGFLSDEFKWYSLQAASSIEEVTSYTQSNTLISYYGRLNLNYDNRFLVTGTLRQDGSSRFGSGNKWGVFPSGAASWRVSQEDFFDVEKISDLKLRVSYGITGNQEIGNYNSLTTLGASSTGYLVGGERLTVVLPQQYANPNLKWEETSQLDAGINFGLFGQRIYGSFDYYYKKTSDLLLSVAVPSPSIVSSQIANVGSVENKGIEFELGMHVIKRSNFSWQADFNFSRNRNKMLSLSNDSWSGDDVQIAPLQGQGLAGGFAQLITEGKPLGTFYGKVFTGVVDGVEQFEDEEDFIGCAQPDFTYGLSNTFNYKNWSLVMNIRGSQGNDVYNLTGNNLGYLINLPGRNVTKSAVESGVKYDQAKQYSSRWIEDGSFLRMDNITLSYTFNVANTFLSNARVYLSGQNLFVITGYSGLDPEVNSEVSGTGVPPLGIDYLSYPKARTFTLGASVSF